MKLTYTPVKIAKSAILLVTSPVENALRVQTAGWLRRREAGSKQVAFVTWDGDTPLLEPADGAAAADGAMALAAWLAMEDGVPTGETWDFALAVSGGSSLPCSVTPVSTCCLVTVTVPRPKLSAAAVSDGLTLPLVRFPDAEYLIVPAGKVLRTAAPELLKRRAASRNTPAQGLLFWDKEARIFDSLILDRISGDAEWHQSSVEGAAAMGAYLAGALGQSVSLHQSGGVMAVTRLDSGAVTVTAPVEAGHGRTAELVF